jgi:hypothetical protein
MRRFHSYGPVNARSHFAVPRTDLVNQCLNSLIGSDNDLADVFDGKTLNLPSLLDRYKAYLVGMKAKGLNPFKDQPR